MTGQNPPFFPMLTVEKQMNALKTSNSYLFFSYEMQSDKSGSWSKIDSTPICFTNFKLQDIQKWSFDTMVLNVTRLKKGGVFAIDDFSQ